LHNASITLLLLNRRSASEEFAQKPTVCGSKSDFSLAANTAQKLSPHLEANVDLGSVNPRPQAADNYYEL